MSDNNLPETIPALFINKSIYPKVYLDSSKVFLTASLFVTSHLIALAI